MANAVIIGCGPAGLLSALAAEQAGYGPVTIYAPVKAQSPMNGAMYLHEPIPGLTDVAPDFDIHVRRIGTREGYAEKVYGDPEHPVSWDKYADKTYPAWSLRDAYQKLWGLFHDQIKEHRVTNDDLKTFPALWDTVICSAPRMAFCNDAFHQFNQAQVWIASEKRADRGPNKMIYNGERIVDWYRYSAINGIESYEFPSRVPMHSDWAVGTKPISTDCTCHPDVIFVGRFGKWEKGCLTHHAYQEVSDALL